MWFFLLFFSFFVIVRWRNAGVRCCWRESIFMYWMTLKWTWRDEKRVKLKLRSTRKMSREIISSSFAVWFVKSEFPTLMMSLMLSSMMKMWLSTNFLSFPIFSTRLKMKNTFSLHFIDEICDNCDWCQSDLNFFSRSHTVVFFEINQLLKWTQFSMFHCVLFLH